MPITCTVYRTHHGGRPLHESRWEGVPGPVHAYTMHRADMRRAVHCLRVNRQRRGGAHEDSPIPDLQDIEMLTFASDRGMMVRGFEEVGGQRYYQSWYIRWD